jgi:phosphate transport system substrate-binding protein
MSNKIVEESTMKRRYLPALAVALLLALGSLSAHAGETVRIHGSTTVQKRVLEPGKDALEKATGITLVLVGNGTGSGLADLVDGKCDASGASEELADAISSMKAAANKEAPAGLKGNHITSDVIKVIVNKKNPVEKLSKEQLKGLHTGKIANWKEVGGPDLPVIVVTSHAGSATKKVFQKAVMDNEPYVAGAVEVETTRKEVENVDLFPEGIGAVSMGFVNLPEYKGKVKVVETQEIGRPLMLITKGEPSANVKKVIDFFTGEGKKYIKD